MYLEEKQMKKCLIRVALSDEGMKKAVDMLDSMYETVICINDGKLLPFSEDDIRDAEVIIGNPSMKSLAAAKSLRWLQLSSSGADQYVTSGLIDPARTVLTNATGAYGHGISEYMIAGVFALIKNLHLYRDNQNRSVWKDMGSISTVNGSKVLIVGYGDIGSHFGEKMHALGADIYAVKRRSTGLPSFVNGPYSLDDVNSLLPQMDIVALCLPNTSSTAGFFDSERFSLMKEGSVLINVGRGNAVDPDALLNALKEGKIHGAVLDVTEPEPLPSDSELWKQKNLLITPHISGGNHSRETVETIESIILENISRFVSGKDLINKVDFSTGYRD